MIAHLPLHRIAEGLARHGVQGRIHAGAQGRSARAFPGGYPRGCQANVLHHTVSSGANPANDINYLISGQGDGFVIANAYAPPNGGIDLIASGPTYTEGKGGPIGLIPANGANTVANSLEIANWGDGVDVYEPLQQRAVLAWSAVSAELAAELWGWPDDPFGADRLFSHSEWSPGRKVDPLGPSAWAPDGGIWNMDAFRIEARQLVQEDDPMKYLSEHVRKYDSRIEGSPIRKGEVRKIELGMLNIAAINVTAISAQGASGYLSIGGTEDASPGTSAVNYDSDRIANASLVGAFPDGHVYIKAHGADCHVTVDLQAYGAAA